MDMDEATFAEVDLEVCFRQFPPPPADMPRPVHDQPAQTLARASYADVEACTAAVQAACTIVINLPVVADAAAVAGAAKAVLVIAKRLPPKHPATSKLQALYQSCEDGATAEQARIGAKTILSQYGRALRPLPSVGVPQGLGDVGATKCDPCSGTVSNGGV